MSYEAWRPRCAICKRSADLTESKADEYGRAVHENCYVSMLVSKKPRRFTERIGALWEQLSLLSHQWASQQVWSVVLPQDRELQDSRNPTNDERRWI
jgi:hypothetical protein